MDNRSTIKNQVILDALKIDVAAKRKPAILNFIVGQDTVLFTFFKRMSYFVLTQDRF